MPPTDRPLDATLRFEGAEIPARAGETIAAALTRAGVRVFRETRGGAGRGLFCGMGVCQDCLVEVDGQANQRACMTSVAGAQEVRRQAALAGTAAAPVAAPRPLRRLSPDVAIVGAGAGGLNAAIAAARAGASVVVLDERKKAGGQYYKQPADAVAGPDEPGADAQFEAGRQLVAAAREAGATILSETMVWGAFAPRELAAIGPEGPLVVTPAKLIVAAGAYERAFPVPGWTLPGVMTTGAVQTLLRSYRVRAGDRILFAGNGPLNLQVAIEAARAGARVVGILEAAAAPGIREAGALLAMARNDPRLVRDGLSYVLAARRLRVPIANDRALVSIEATPEGLVATSSASGDAGRDVRRHEPVDVVACGYGFLPGNEILRTLGARHEYDSARRMLATIRDADGLTSLADVYAVGDCCGLGGAPAAREEGTIAGAAAAAALGHRVEEAAIAAARGRLARHRAFQKALWRVYAAPLPALGRPAADTHVCRCEEVSLATIDAAIDEGSRTLGDIKRRTRAGMGRCQGRYCASLVAERLAERADRPIEEMSFFAPRVPFKPVSLADLAAAPEADERAGA